VGFVDGHTLLRRTAFAGIEALVCSKAPSTNREKTGWENRCRLTVPPPSAVPCAPSQDPKAIRARIPKLLLKH
jgi:hypothetical protein